MASCGALLRLDAGLDPAAREASIVVCGGIDAHLAATPASPGWLRPQARMSAHLGGGLHLRADPGARRAAEGRRCTIHSENRAAFAEALPDAEATGRAFEIDGDRMTRAGGAAADTLLAVIVRDNGPRLARLVAGQMTIAPLRTEADDQRLSAPARIGARSPRLSAIVELMEANLEDPISLPDPACEARISVRQLERLFRRYRNRSPKRHYMQL